MKRCVKEHVIPSFGVIPVGSLWEDDSPYVTDAKLFKDVLADGGLVTQTGYTLVGESGPEMVTLPKGSTIRKAG